jgi:hypothetical protein
MRGRVAESALTSTESTKQRAICALAVVVAVGMALHPEPAAAWGDQGHKVICELAMRLAQPSTRAEIQKLMSTDERFTSFSESCTWPDHPRQRASEHFVNLSMEDVVAMVEEWEAIQ